MFKKIFVNLNELLEYKYPFYVAHYVPKVDQNVYIV